MRIAHLCLDYPPRRTRYGSGTVADDLIAELTRRGHDIRILTPGRIERRHLPKPDPRLIEVPVELSPRYLLPSDRPTEMFASVEQVLAWNTAARTWFDTSAPLNDWIPQFIHNDGWSTQPLAEALAARYSRPIISTAHVIDRHYAAVRDLPQRPAETQFRVAEAACFDRSDIIIVPSQTALELATYYYPSTQRKLRVVAHGLDWFSVDQNSPSSTPHHTDTANITVHYLGRISSERGWQPFLTAFRAAAEQDHRLRLRVIGDGRLAQAREQFRHPAISFLGALPRAQVLDELRRGDIYCNPALMETFGMAELEALGQGLCVISNTGFGKHTHTEHLQTGIHVPLLPGPRPQLDQQAWQTWLQALADKPALRRRLAAAGQRTARQQYSIATMATNLVTVFEQATKTASC